MKKSVKLVVAVVGMTVLTSLSLSLESNAGCWKAWYNTEATTMVCPSAGTGKCTVCFGDDEE